MSSDSRFGNLRSWFHRLDGKGQLLRPTVTPTTGFSANADAERIHRAMKGLGTNEDELIEVLARRTNHERQAIRAAYESQQNKKLRKAIKDDTSGNFRTILCQLVFDVPYMLAKSLYYAMKGVGTNERVLIEVLVTLWNDEMRAVSDAYMEVLADEKCDTSKRSLVKDIENETSGDFRYALLQLIKAERDEIPALQLKDVVNKGVQSVINVELAERDAKELLAAGAGRVGSSEQRIIRVVCGRTTFQLAAAAEKYMETYGKSLLDDMRSELSGDLRDLVISLIRYAIDRPSLIAEWLHDSMAGLGTRDYTLMRLLITRSEIDLEDIKEAYQRLYEKSLWSDVAGDTSGDYGKTMARLLGEKL